jgi:hypothetical protein
VVEPRALVGRKRTTAKLKLMRKAINILEIPLYLLMIGVITLEEGYLGWSIFLFVVSILRLWVNTITYKENS